MQISHVSPRYFPAISGSEFYIQEISEKIQDPNHKIKVYCSNALDFQSFGTPRGKRVDPGHSKINNIDIFRYPIKYVPGINVFLNNTYFAYKKVLKKLNFRFNFPLTYLNLIANGPFTPHLPVQMLRDHFDIIHTVCMPLATNLFAMFVAKLKKVPCICTPFFHYMNPRYHDSTYIEFLNNFTKILSCSYSETKYLISNGLQKAKIKQIQMGIDTKKYFKGKADKFRLQFDLNDDQKIILFCGYKNFEKGAITLLHSVKYVVKKFPNCRFVFIGPSTTAFNRTKRSLGAFHQNIINLGVVPYYAKIKLDAFAAQDVYVMPSRSDAYGIAFLEAWINKKPVIGARVGATPEIIHHKTDGLLVPFHSPVELAKTICYLLSNEQESRKLGENGYQKIQNQTWDNIAIKIKEIYEELASN